MQVSRPSCMKPEHQKIRVNITEKHCVGLLNASNRKISWVVSLQKWVPLRRAVLLLRWRPNLQGREQSFSLSVVMVWWQFKWFPSLKKTTGRINEKQPLSFRATHFVRSPGSIFCSVSVSYCCLMTQQNLQICDSDFIAMRRWFQN
jgi:hypothetical protein